MNAANDKLLLSLFPINDLLDVYGARPAGTAAFGLCLGTLLLPPPLFESAIITLSIPL